MDFFLSLQEDIDNLTEDSIEILTNNILKILESQKDKDTEKFIFQIIISNMFYNFTKHMNYLKILQNIVSTNTENQYEYYKTIENLDIPIIKDTFKSYVIKQIQENHTEFDCFSCTAENEYENIDYILVNDDVDLLCNLSTRSDFNYNMRYTMKESPFIFSHYSLRLIDLAAFLGAVKCFKNIFLNKYIADDLPYYALAGGNMEIVRICYQNNISFEESASAAFKFFHNDLSIWIVSEYQIESYLYIDLIKETLKNRQYRLMMFLFNNIFNDLSNCFSQAEKEKLITSLIRTAIKKKDNIVLSYLISSCPINIDYTNSSFLFDCIQYQNKDAFLQFLELGKININLQQPRTGNTILHHAIILKDTFFYDKLLSHPDINLNITNKLDQKASDLLSYRMLFIN